MTWTVLSLLTWSTDHLREKGIESPRLTTELLLAHALGIQRLALYLQFDRPLKPDEMAAFKSSLLRKLKREPLDYILGETEFYGRPFTVSPAVLIPRPETEGLVEVAAERLRGRTTPTILDIGSGSGCIAVTLALLVPAARVTALEVSPAALDVAMANARRHNAAVYPVLADLFDTGALPVGPFDLIVSNPPYIPDEDRAELEPEVLKFEPALALFSGADPLHFYRRLADLVPTHLAPDGWLIAETHADGAESVAALWRAANLADVTVTADLAGIPRVVAGRKT